jgi:hypothetical protein
MTRLRDHYPFDEEKGFAGPLDPATFADPEELQGPYEGDLPSWPMVLLAIPFILFCLIFNRGR